MGIGQRTKYKKTEDEEEHFIQKLLNTNILLYVNYSAVLKNANRW
jgi:hypothetical protein